MDIPEIKTPWADLFAKFPDDDSSRQLDDEERAQCEDLEWELKYTKPKKDEHNLRD